MFNDAFGGRQRIDLFPANLEPERAFRALFAALDELESHLATRRYLFGTRILEVDWRLFCTLIRFDTVYHGHFKSSISSRGIAATVNIDHIKRHYYFTHDDINPTRIVPLGALLDFTSPPGREHLAAG